MRYLEEVVVALGRASEEQFDAARDFFSQLPQRTTVLWIESSRTQALLREMEKRGLSVGQDGKGRSAWDSLRYSLAGEFAMAADLAAVNRIPGDWGLEVGTLAETPQRGAGTGVPGGPLGQSSTSLTRWAGPSSRAGIGCWRPCPTPSIGWSPRWRRTTASLPAGAILAGCSVGPRARVSAIAAAA